MKKFDKENAIISNVLSQKSPSIIEQSPSRKGMLQEDTNNAVNSPSKQNPSKINSPNRRLVFWIT